MPPAAARLLACCLVCATFQSAAEQTVTLNEGTDLRVSANRAGDRLSFDLAGLIWVLNPADGTAQPLTQPELLARRPALSPDGERIAFQSGIPGNRQLQLIGAAGGEPELLTYGDFDHDGPAWHPGGQRLAFASDRGGDLGIWELEPDTLALRQRSFAPGDERDPAYDARGERLAYVGAAGDGEGLYVLPAEGPPQLILSVPGSLHAPAWRPDGSLLTFVHRSPARSELRMVILSDPPVVKQLTRGENVFASPALWLDSDEFIYAADGRLRRRRFDDFDAIEIPFRARLSIAEAGNEFSAKRLPAAEPGPARGITGYGRVGERRFASALGDLWELDANGVAVRKLSAAPFLDTQLSAAPDGRGLEFVSDRGGSLQVWFQDLEGAAPRQLTAEPGAALEPAWRPDGGAIAYLAEPHAQARSLALKMVTLADGQTREIARGLPDATPPAWLPDGAAISLRAGRRALVFPVTGDPARPALPEAGSEFRYAPDGSHIAWMDGERLFVAQRGADGRPMGATRLADGDVSRPRWVNGGGQLVWLGPAGLTGWTAADARTAPVPVGIAWQAALPAPDRRLVIRAGKVFDGLGPGYQEAQDIVIAGGRIESIGPWRDPPAGELLDARELTVIPGLMDLAVRPRRAQGEAEGRTWLAFGVTSIREFVADRATSLERRESWASGQRPGPRLFPVLAGCGEQRPPAIGEAAVAIAVCAEQSGTSQAQWIRRARAGGVGAIALAAFPGALLGADEIPFGRPAGQLAGYPDAANRLVYGDVVEIAGAAGLTAVSGLSAVGFPALLRSELAGLAADNRLADLFSPTTVAWYRQSWRRQAESVRTALRAEARTAGQSLFRAVGRGARLVTGSQAPDVPAGLGLHAELRMLQATGLQGFQVLRMATRDAAAAMGLAGELGSIGPGLVADLVLVRGDPLRDIGDAARVEITIVNGRIYSQSALLAPPGVGNFYSP